MGCPMRIRTIKNRIEIMKEFVVKALRNYGYRFVGKRRCYYIFGKPLGYGILRADVSKGEGSVSIMLIVKGNVQNGKRPNLIWGSKSQDFPEEEDDEQKMYEAVVRAIAYCEADIFSTGPVAILQNCNVRYDFEENVHIE